MDATVVRQKLIFHALVRQLEAEVVSEEALAQYLSLGGSDNLELLRELLMCFFWWLTSGNEQIPLELEVSMRT